MSSLIKDKKELRDGIDHLIELYFNQPNILYSHLFSSYHQLIEEIIPYILEKESNYFFDNVTKDAIYLYGFRFENTKILPPVRERDNEIVFPQMARKNYLNYFSNINSKVTQFQEKVDLVTGERTFRDIGEPEEVVVASVPIMVKSKYCSTFLKPETSKYECKYDPGGYFIVGGQEKVVVSIEKMIDNKVLVFGKSDSSFPNGKMFTAQINSRKHDWSENLQIIAIRNNKDDSLVTTTSQLNEIPVMILLRALGLENDKELVLRITNNLEDVQMINLLRNSLDNSLDDDGNLIRTKDEAIYYLLNKIKSGRRISQTDEEVAIAQKKLLLEKIFMKDLLPHLGADVNGKISFICLMIKKILMVMLNRVEEDDRDAFENKRIETPGVLIGQLFRQNFNKMLKEIGKLFRKKNNSDENPINMVSQIKPTTIEQGIKSGLATGIWGLSKTKAGVAQSLSRLTWLKTISDLRKIKSPSMNTSTSKLTSIRQINNIQAFFVCNIETPEGQPIGLSKSLSLMATITPRLESQYNLINDILDKHEKLEHPFNVNPEDFDIKIKILHNGNLKGVLNITDGLSFYKNLREMRRNGKINKMVSISLDYIAKEIIIYTDAGRLIRPLLNVENNELLLTKDIVKDVKKELVSENKTSGWNRILLKYSKLIEYEDIESTRSLMIAMDLDMLQKNKQNQDEKINFKEEVIKPNRYGKFRYVKYTHSEFHPSMMLGTIVSTVPFINQNPSPRGIIYFSQAKQAMGIYSTAFKDRMDISNILYHPQVPLVTTSSMKYSRFLDLPSGENAIVAILSYTGYNQEDSIIINQSALDRGLFRADSLRKYNSKIEKNPSSSQDDIFIKPDRNKVTGMSRGNYEKLNDKGYIPEETIINDKDVLIGKVSPIQPTSDNKVFKDKSELFKTNVEGVVDRVHKDVFNSDGYEMISMRVRMERNPIIGDKFCQKYDTEVLTNKGWIKLGEIDIMKHKVVTLDGNGNLVYINPSKKFEFDYNDKFYTYKSNYVDIECTLNHKLYCKKLDGKEFELIKAENIIGKVVQMKNNGNNNFPIVETYKNYEINNWVKLLSIFITNGKIIDNVIYLNYPNKIDKKDFIFNVLGELKINYTCGNYIVFKDSEIIKELKLSENQLPEYVWTLDKENSKTLLESLIFLDGHKFEHNFETLNETMANDISRLALHSGYGSKIIETKNKYKVCIIRNDNNLWINKNYCKEQVIDYNGKVYCIEVPESHIYYMRTNKFSPPIWIGNSTRHGQKGTTGLTLPQRDMPFTAEGIIPDIIFNPHGMPSRMTMGQLCETLGSKIAANIGSLFDGTPFNDYDIKDLPKLLKEIGYNQYGTEEMYCGITGRKMRAQVFIGPVYYLRLKHMVHDKMHPRATGPRQAITRQPMEGRSKDGGLKIGEMEKDSMVAHGIGQYLKERMMETSDITTTVICDKCGLFATKVMDKDYYVCNNCNNNTEFSKIAIPYAFKLLIQELMSVNIVPRIRTEKYDL